MKWRTVLGVTVGLLLPLPFMFDHCGAMLREHQRQVVTSPGAKIVPILELDEKRALLTYGRSCQDPKDCDPPLACAEFFSGEERICIDSDCRTDRQCKQGFTCRTRQVPGASALIHQCVLIGSQKEGQPCFDSAAEPEEACAPGLFCSGGHCGRPCELDVPSSCPAGFVCRAGLDAPSCQPFCRGGDCPAGQECVGAGTREARCMIVHGENCHHHPCPERHRCVVNSAPGGEVWRATMECLTPCNETQSCPEGSVCFLGGCRRKCGPDAGEVCGPHQRCSQFPADRLWVCKTPLE